MSETNTLADKVLQIDLSFSRVAALDLLFDHIDDCITINKLETLETLDSQLGSLVVCRYSNMALIAVLTATWEPRKQLPSRQAFCTKVENYYKTNNYPLEDLDGLL